MLQRLLGRTKGEVTDSPESMNFVGAGDFVAIGEKWRDYFVNSCALAPDAHVLAHWLRHWQDGSPR